jgi:hypothetical protein
VSGVDLATRLAVTDVSYAYARGIDHRDWDLYRRLFTDECSYDFSSWSGTPGATMRADDWVDGVRRVNGSFDSTQHLMTNHHVVRVDDGSGVETVECVNEMRAQHWLSAETMASLGKPAVHTWCIVAGHYTNRYVRTDDTESFDGWKITSLHFTCRWRDGDESIFALARRRS